MLHVFSTNRVKFVIRKPKMTINWEGWSTEECDEVDDVEALELELGDDGGQSVVGSRDVVVGALHAGATGVPSPQRHDPPRAAGLHQCTSRTTIRADY